MAHIFYDQKRFTMRKVDVDSSFEIKCPYCSGQLSFVILEGITDYDVSCPLCNKKLSLDHFDDGHMWLSIITDHERSENLENRRRCIKCGDAYYRSGATDQFFPPRHMNCPKR
jgi:hypothetical protein